MLLLLNEREPPSPKSEIMYLDTEMFCLLVSCCSKVVAISLTQMSSKRFFSFSGLYFFHHFHHNCSRAGQNEVAHCPVIHVENVEAVDRYNKLANLRRKASSKKSYALDFFLRSFTQVYYWLLGHAKPPELFIPSHSALRKNTFLRINLES